MCVCIHVDPAFMKPAPGSSSYNTKNLGPGRHIHHRLPCAKPRHQPRSFQPALLNAPWEMPAVKVWATILETMVTEIMREEANKFGNQRKSTANGQDGLLQNSCRWYRKMLEEKGRCSNSCKQNEGDSCLNIMHRLMRKNTRTIKTRAVMRA